MVDAAIIAKSGELFRGSLSLLTPAWGEVLNCLTNDLPIPKKYKDHALTGNYKGFRDCHIKPDLVLIYRVQSDIVDLVRLGSHSEVFD